MSAEAGQTPPGAEAEHKGPVTINPGRTIVIALYVYFAATVGRLLAELSGDIYVDYTRLAWLLGLQLVFLILYTLVLWRPPSRRLLLYAYFGVQSLLILAAQLSAPTLDFLSTLFFLLSYQAALYFYGRTRQAVIALFVILDGGVLMVSGDPLRNLALALPTMAGIVVLAGYIAAAQEQEAARLQGLAMLDELQQANHQLQAYTEQVEELAAIEERNRLARELHDSVSQTMFSVILNVRAAQMLLERGDPARLKPQLVTLQKLAQSALAEMRSLIAQLRPK